MGIIYEKKATDNWKGMSSLNIPSNFKVAKDTGISFSSGGWKVNEFCFKRYWKEEFIYDER